MFDPDSPLSRHINRAPAQLQDRSRPQEVR
jgi:hypothetical protein